MKILVLNCGSSSLKYQLIDMKDESVMAKGPDRRAGISKGASEALPCVRLEVLVLGGHFRRISDMLIPLAECRTAPLCEPYPCRIPLQKGAHPCTWAAPCFALPHRGQGFLIK